MSNFFGTCKDKHVTFFKGFDSNGCAIVTIVPAEIKENCPLEDQTCEIPLGPFLKGVIVNGNTLEIDSLNALLNVEYVEYDPDLHEAGDEVLGTGTATDPLQIPVKECNFEFTVYDPLVHVPGDELEGTGEANDPWLIPVKETNFEFVTYDPTIHQAGQPLEGTGTAADPWLIPVKECNFEYVAYDDTVHATGAIEGTGTPTDPWQIPLFEVNTDLKVCAVRLINTPADGNNVYSMEYDICNKEGLVVDTLVANDIPVPTFVDKNGAPLEGEIELLTRNIFVDRGNDATEAVSIFGTNVAGECEAYSFPQTPVWAYAPFDESVHQDGDVAGDGTVDSPFQIPLPVIKECNFTYVDFDPTIHGETGSGVSAIVGDGTAANPWQIPRPCCEEVCDPIDTLVSIEDMLLEACVEQTVTFDVTANVLERGSEGFAVIGQNSTLSIPQVVPVPAATPGNVLILHYSHGDDAQVGTLNNNTLFDADIALPSAPTIGNPVLLSEMQSNAEFNHSIVAYDVLTGAAGATIDVTFPDNIQGTDPLNGVANWHWIEVSRTDGGTLTVADVGGGSDLVYTGTTVATTPQIRHSIDNAENCPALVMTTGRHVHNFNAQSVDVITDTDWVQYNNATGGSVTELYDTVSQERSTNYAPCQLGMGAAFIDPNTSFDLFTANNIPSGNSAVEWVLTHVMPVICEKVECVPVDGPDPVTIDYSSPDCERSGTKNVSADAEVTAGPGATVTVMPVINGVDYPAGAVTLNNSAGTAADTQSLPMSFSYPLGTVAENGSGQCTFNLELRVDSGDAAGAGATITNASATVSLA